MTRFVIAVALSAVLAAAAAAPAGASAATYKAVGGPPGPTGFKRLS